MSSPATAAAVSSATAKAAHAYLNLKLAAVTALVLPGRGASRHSRNRIPLFMGIHLNRRNGGDAT
jgi:hypothetical protein